jgi:hypothetical protein
MKKATTGQAGGWTLAFETLTVVATLAFFLSIKTLWPEAMASSRLIPRGTVLKVQLDDPISSRSAQLGDQFYGHILSVQGADELALTLAGVRVVGRCVAARDGQPAGEPGYLRLALSGLIDSAGHIEPLDTSTVSFWGHQVITSEGAAGLALGGVLARDADAAGSAESSEEVVAAPGRQLSFLMLRPAIVPHP